MALEIKESKYSKQLWSTGGSIALAIISLAFGATLFVLAYLGMKNHNGLGSFNQIVLDKMVAHRSGQLTAVMHMISNIGEPNLFIFVVVGIAIFWAIFRREIWRPLLLVGTTGVASVASKLIKAVTENARPPQALMLKPFETDFSFTSGHTVAITIFCLMFGYLICSRNSSIKGFLSWAILTIIAVGAMIASRLYLGHHWLTDTVGAVGLCLAIFAVSIIIDRIFIKITNR